MSKYLSWVIVLLLTFPGLGFSQLEIVDEANKKSVVTPAKTETRVFPEKVEADKNFDGKPDYAEYYKNGIVERREADTDFDGIMDEWTHFDANGKPVKTERDTNKDGKPDAWVYY